MLAVAIMMHDMSNIYRGKEDIPENSFLRLSFDKDPLSAMVTLVDTIEDFERPTASFDDDGKGNVTIEYDTSCSANIEINNSGVMTISYKMKSHEDYMCKLKHLPTERDNIFDRHHGYLDMSSIGVNKVRLRAER